MGETQVSAAIRAAIKKHYPQIRFTRLQCGFVRVRGGVMKLADPGWPDYVGYLPDGRFFGLEIKAPKAKTAKEREIIQTARAIDIKLCGGVAIKASSVEEALNLIEKEVKQ